MKAGKSFRRAEFNQSRRAMAVSVVLPLMALVGPSATQAQTSADAYPNRPIRIVVGFPPGGSSDIAARQLGTALGAKLGQPVIIDNKPGANTAIAAQFVKGQPADGYTLLATQSSFVINPYLQKLNYNVKTDFTPVALLGLVPLVMVAPNQVQANTVSELLASAKAQPGKLSYASYGTGSAGHIASELMLSMSGTEIVHVPYKGSGPALVDLMGNQVSMMLATVTASIGAVKEGKLKAIAVTSDRRVGVLPDVPTVAESGLGGYELVEWESLQVPAGTPKDIVEKLNQAINEVLATPEVRDRFTGLGIETGASKSSAEVAQFEQKEAEKLARIIQDRNIKLQ